MCGVLEGLDGGVGVGVVFVDGGVVGLAGLVVGGAVGCRFGWGFPEVDVSGVGEVDGAPEGTVGAPDGTRAGLAGRVAILTATVGDGLRAGGTAVFPFRLPDRCGIRHIDPMTIRPSSRIPTAIDV